jgi:transcriptional regulator with XRE-family HTH domain
MNACVEFGKFLKSVRLANGITAREASQAAGFLSSNFSKLEHGVLHPPKDPAKQKQLAQSVGIKPETPEETEFFDLAGKANRSTPVDLADIISAEDALPLLLRTIGNKRLTKADIQKLVAIVRGLPHSAKL